MAELAESGDGDQLRAALALAGGPIPLPGGRVLTVEPDAGGESEARARGGRPRCGSSCTRPRSVRSSCAFGLHGGALTSTWSRTQPSRRPRGALPELREAVLSSTGLVPRVEVVERRGAAPPAPVVVPVDEVRRYG